MARVFETPLGLFTAASDPATPTPATGNAYYNTTTNTVRVYNGATWVEAASRSLSFFMS